MRPGVRVFLRPLADRKLWELVGAWMPVSGCVHVSTCSLVLETDAAGGISPSFAPRRNWVFYAMKTCGCGCTTRCGAMWRAARVVSSALVGDLVFFCWLAED